MSEEVKTEKKKGHHRIFERLTAVTESRARYMAKVTPIDRFLAATFLPLFPKTVRPNHITAFRFVSVPFILYLFISDYMLSGTILFLFSAFSDALDGALARTTKQITPWGVLFDPLADKLLVGSVALLLVSTYISVYLALAIVLPELLLVAAAYFRYRGRLTPAKTVGKIKMILQCFGIIFLLFYILFGVEFLLGLAAWTLTLAVVFALLSLLVYRSI